MSNLETTGGQTDQSIAATDAAVNAAKAKVATRATAKLEKIRMMIDS